MSRHDAFHDFLLFQEVNGKLRLKISYMGLGIVQVDEEVVNKEKAAEYLWKRLAYQLERQ